MYNFKYKNTLSPILPFHKNAIKVNIKLTDDIISYKTFLEEKSMLKKMIVSIFLMVGLYTTGIMAQSNTDELAKLASKHETLSKNIVTAYSKKDRGMSALVIIDTLESEQIKLKSKIDNPEISNLLIFLTMCVKDLKTVVKKPYSSKNAELVADLSTSIQEGSHYIRQSI